MEPIESQIREIISTQVGHITQAEMVPEAELVRDLGADSLDVELIRTEIEDVFAVDISDEAMDKLKTIQDVVNLVRELKMVVQ